MTEQELLIDCLARLNKLGADYYLTGSMASNYWGIPRTTHALDFVLRIEPAEVKRMVELFRDEYYVDEGSIRAASQLPYQFNLIDTRSALKVDCWYPKPAPFDEEMFRRRIATEIGGVPAWIATAEDVILHKLVWNAISPSDRQMKDAAGVWAVQKGLLDRAYMELWARRLGVLNELEKIMSDAIRPKAT